MKSHWIASFQKRAIESIAFLEVFRSSTKKVKSMVLLNSSFFFLLLLGSDVGIECTKMELDEETEDGRLDND